MCLILVFDSLCLLEEWARGSYAHLLSCHLLLSLLASLIKVHVKIEWIVTLNKWNGKKIVILGGLSPKAH